MELLTDLEARLRNIEKRAIELVQNLEEQSTIEQSLIEARSSLSDTSNSVGRLIDSTKSATDSLQALLSEFRTVVRVLQDADPARAHEAIIRLEEHLDTDHQETIQTISEVVGALSRDQALEVARLKRTGIVAVATGMVLLVLVVAILVMGVLSG